MDFRHSCSFCGWGRTRSTPVMLSPNCERCGCALDATPMTAAVVAAAPAYTLGVRSQLAMRLAGVLVALLGLYAAAKVGYDAGGASGALIAFGAGGFLLLPFVPERV